MVKKFIFLILLLTLLGSFFTYSFLPNKPSFKIKDLTKVPERPNTKVIKNIKATDLNLIINDPNINIIDVRTEKEFSGGHLSKAKNIDFYNKTFEQEIAKLDKNKKYLIYCRSRNRSSITLELMKKLNFSNVINLYGGILIIDQKSLCSVSVNLKN